MRNSNGFRDYNHFRDEILRHRATSWSSRVEDIADEMYQTDVQDEFKSMWDAVEDDEE